MPRPQRIFAMYKGDTFITEGTIEEMAKKLGYTYNYVATMSSQITHKRDKGNRKILVEIGVKKRNKKAHRTSNGPIQSKNINHKEIIP